MTIAVRPIYQALGANNPNKQISVTRWNDGSALTGAAGASILFDQDGAAFDVELTVNAFAYMSEEERESVIARDYLVNVTDALTAASARIQALGGGTLILPPGGYLVGKQTFHGDFLDGTGPAAYGPQEILTVKNVGHVRISGYGAVLKADPSMRYGSFDPVTGERYDPVLPFYDYSYYAYPYRGMINLEGNDSVTIEGLELDGNNENIILGGHWGDSQWQLEGSGLWIKGNDRVTIRDVYSHHHPSDGMVLAYAGLTEASPAKPTLIDNFKATYNARQGISLVGGKGITFINAELSYTGRAMNGAEQVQTFPSDGIDIEAESSVVRDVLFLNPRMLGNYARGLGGASGNSARVTVAGGVLEGCLTSRFAYRFDGVTFLGKTEFGVPLTNEYTGLPTTEEDGPRFNRCHFLYDPALTEEGVLVNDDQSDWNEANWGKWTDCVIDTGDQLLPDAYNATLVESSPIWENCIFRSTYVGASDNGLTGHFRGVNRITASDTVVMGVGTASEVEYGTTYLNGVSV